MGEKEIKEAVLESIGTEEERDLCMISIEGIAWEMITLTKEEEVGVWAMREEIITQIEEIIITEIDLRPSKL